MALSREEILNWVENHVTYGSGIEVLKNDCEIIEFMLDNCEIEIPEQNRFFGKVNCVGISDVVIAKRKAHIGNLAKAYGYGDGVKAMAYTGYYDFSHTTAEWESVINLGIYGLRCRISEYGKRAADEGAVRFYTQLLRVFDAALRFIKRAADKALLSGKNEMATALLILTEGSPRNLSEALQTSIIYYVLQHPFDGT